MPKNEQDDRRFFARAPTTSMWLIRDEDGLCKVKPDFRKACSFETMEMASKAWDEACLDCLNRCARTGDAVPAWALSRPVFPQGRTPECATGKFDYYLGLVDGRFVTERLGGALALSTDEREAKVFGSLDEARTALMGMLASKSKGKSKPASVAILPMRCVVMEPVEIEGSSLDALACASYAKSLRDQWSECVPVKEAEEGSRGASGQGAKRL